LADAVSLCLQFTTSREDVEKIRMGLKDWVLEYEKLHYQNNPAIEAAGPAWTSKKLSQSQVGAEEHSHYQPKQKHSRRLIWAKVRRLEGGDEMKAAALDSLAEDRREATWIRYDQLVDKHARNSRRRSEFVLTKFYGQLQNILVVPLPAASELGLEVATTLILAHIHACDGVTFSNPRQVPYYTKMGRHEVVDMNSVQCLIGRIPPASQNGKWAIIDRSGSIELSTYSPE
ncbi:hypothetical protein MPER_08606, partial [Moniliophthora perniciosa FA553]